LFSVQKDSFLDVKAADKLSFFDVLNGINLSAVFGVSIMSPLFGSTLSNSENIPKKMKVGFVVGAILSYNSFIFNFETGTFTWFFCASKKIFDISRVISVT